MTIVGAGVTFGVMAAAQIAIPLTSDDATIEWLSSLVVVAFFATSLLLAGAHWGAARALAAAAFVTVATLVVERLGSTTGFPFGEYEYTGALEPTVGEVPVIVPLAWFAMGPPALEVARRITRHPLGVVAIGAAALTAWDLFLDPQMVGEGYWRWRRRGAYRGIPASNFVGWVLTGLGVMTALEVLLPPGRPDPVLVGEYAYMATMETVGFAAFFRDPMVAAVGGAAMVPLAAGAVRRLVGWRRAGCRRAGAS